MLFLENRFYLILDGMIFESLFIHLGAEVEEGRGSRVCFILNKRKIVFHRPHPTPIQKRQQWLWQENF